MTECTQSESRCWILGEPCGECRECYGNGNCVPVGECTDGETRLCPYQNGVCSGSGEVCTNCYWPGCDYTAIPGYETPEVFCQDVLDNDCDGNTDCGDPDCFGPPDCTVETICFDMFDNDADGCIDDKDSNCGGSETICDDLIDNDCDGLTDDADIDCSEPSTIPTLTEWGIIIFMTIIIGIGVFILRKRRKA